MTHDPCPMRDPGVPGRSSLAVCTVGSGAVLHMQRAACMWFSEEAAAAEGVGIARTCASGRLDGLKHEMIRCFVLCFSMLGDGLDHGHDST